MLKYTAIDLEYESGPTPTRPEKKVEIALYITPSLPRALQLYGEVAAGDDDSSTCISFVGVSQVMQDWLEKFIFRHHRRSGAHAQVSRWLLWPISLSSVAARHQIHKFLCVGVGLLVQQ